MLNFLKKELTPTEATLIALDISLFLSWMLENFGPLENVRQCLGEIIDRVVRVNDRKTNSNTSLFIQMNILDNLADNKKLIQLREQSGFDKKVDGFCRSINIRKPLSSDLLTLFN